MVEVDTEVFLAIVAVGTLAALIAGLIAPRLAVPVVVLEILLGILIGPDVLDIAQPNDFVEFFSNLGLGMLFFFAGYEIDFDRIRGRPVELAVIGWIISLALAYTLGGLLAWAGVVLSLVYTGSALATTAIGTLIPILHDAGELRTKFGTYLLGAGAIGEFGPIMLITLVFSTQNPAAEGLLLVAFVVIAVVAGIVATRGLGGRWELFERNLETSGQLAIRTSVLMIFALVALATSLGLDLLLGGFVAGIILRIALKGREVERFESKLTAVGYGFLIPFFFVASGLSFDLQSLIDNPGDLYKLPLFFVLFLVVRGLPVLILYVREFELRDRIALGVFASTELPLVVAITTIAVDEGHMRTTTAASLVGAAILSTAILPLIGLRLRGDRALAEQAV